MIITVSVVGVIIIFAGIGAWLMCQGIKVIDAETDYFWNTYESKPQEYYEEFSRACESILDSYRSYDHYPLDIPVNNNPAVPEIIRDTLPYEIMIWAPDHVSITVTDIGDGMGYKITWKKVHGGDYDWKLILGPDHNEGLVVYTR